MRNREATEINGTLPSSFNGLQITAFAVVQIPASTAVVYQDISNFLVFSLLSDITDKCQSN